MQLPTYMIAVSLLTLTLWDAFVTVFSTAGGGPLTNFWTQKLWRFLLVVHRRKPIHRLLSYTGPLMLVSVILVWYVMLSTSWLLLFLADDRAVVVNDNGAPASFVERVYFTGTTVSSIGYGDLVPSGLPWTLCKFAF